MNTNLQDISNIDEMVLHLLSISMFYGDYAVAFHMNNPSSTVSLSIRKRDLAALKKFALKNWIDFNLLEDKQLTELEAIYEQIKQNYLSKLDFDNPRLPDDFMIELGERALTMGKFRDAHSAFKDAQKLDQRVNQFVSEAIRILQTKEISSADASNEQIEQKCQQVATFIFNAVKLKNPFGNQFQKLGPNLHYHDTESLRKFNKYIEQSLFKEIIDFGIRYLIDDKSISEKIISHLSSGKIRRQVLKQLAIIFSGGQEKYKTFCQNYLNACQLASSAKTEQDYMKVQKTLLGRGTGDNEHYQFLQELSLEHPISALLLATVQSPEGKKFTVPRILKSGESLLEFLGLQI